MNKPQTFKNTTFIPAITKMAREANKVAKNSWLSAYRNAHIDALEQAEFPHAQIEHFKYNRLNAFDANDFDHAATASAQSFDITEQKICGLTSDNSVERIIFVNGIFSKELSSSCEHKIVCFSEANSDQQKKILKQLNAQNDFSHNPFTQVCASLLDNGVFIEIDETSPKALIEVLHIIDENTENSTLSSQVIVDVAPCCIATMVSRSLNWTSHGKKTNLSTQQTLVNIGDSATLTHYALQLENANTLYFGSSEYNLDSHATLRAFYGATGSTLKKLDISVNHNGQHAHAFLDGLYAATDDQQIDYHTTINHPLPNGETDEVFRGIVNGKAEATFNGRIHILEDAQKTRAELSNKNLVLSDNAQIHTKPELEIYADDVVCAHGATVSRMNDESLNYLRARGINKDEAELMLSYGFFDEVFRKLEHQAIADYLRPILFKRFE